MSLSNKLTSIKKLPGWRRVLLIEVKYKYFTVYDLLFMNIIDSAYKDHIWSCLYGLIGFYFIAINEVKSNELNVFYYLISP